MRPCAVAATTPRCPHLRDDGEMVGGTSPTCTGGVPRARCADAPPFVSEQLEVPLELPGRDLLVRRLELPPLEAAEVVHVGLAAGVSEPLAEHVVAFELAGRVEEVLRQHLDAEVVALALRQLVEVELGRRVARLEAVLDPVE